MSYAITTIENHKSALESISKRNQERFEAQTDPSDCALSSWGENAMSRFHDLAISLLESGLKELGKEVPYSTYPALADSDGNIVSIKLASSEFYGKVKYSWVLNAEMTEKYGRKYIPSSKNSRIQKSLNLKETKVGMESKPYLVANCSFVGGSVSYRSLPLSA